MKNRRFRWTVIVTFIVILTVVFVVMVVYYSKIGPAEIAGNTVLLAESGDYSEMTEEKNFIKTAEEKDEYGEAEKKATLDLAKLYMANSDMRRVD